MVEQCNQKFIYENGKTTGPNFIIAKSEDSEEVIFLIFTREKTTKGPSSMKEVVHIERAKEIIAGIHRPGGNAFLWGYISSRTPSISDTPLTATRKL